MRQFRFVPVQEILCRCLIFLVLQAYVALCCSKEWKEEWKGVKFARLYILLREQFAHPDDPWHIETLNWWNEFCLSIHCLYFICSQSFRKIFGGTGETSEESPEAARDMENPSTRERMDNERRERIRAAAGN